MVVFSHFVLLWDPAQLSRHAHILLLAFYPLTNGQSSVILFFLLSGFVLTLPFQRGTALPYPIFLMRRLARIYVPYLAALALAAAADYLFHAPVAVSPWCSQTWSVPLTPSILLQHVLLIGNYDTAQINTAFWSLPVEMRLSIAFPLLCLPLLRGSRWIVLVFLACFVILDVAVSRSLVHRLELLSFKNLSDMTSGLVTFAVGILLARWQQLVRLYWARAPRGSRVVLAAVSLVALGWSGVLNQSRLWPLVLLFTIAGAAGVLIVALCSHRVSRLLNHALPAWLGRISYSLYLVHATVLFTLVHVFFGPASRLQLLPLYLILALLGAALFYRVVERPSIHLSRSIGRRTA